MNLQNCLDAKLKMETLRRVSHAPYFFMGLSVVIWFLFQTSEGHGIYWNIAIGGVFSVNLIRIIAYRIASKKSQAAALAQFKFQMLFLLAGVGIFGGIIAASVLQFGLYSMESIILCFCMLGILTGSLHTLAPSLFYHKAYASLLVLPTALASLFSAKNLFEQICGYLFVVYLPYLFVVGKKLNSQLTDGFRSEESLLREKEKLNETINSVPGFVAILAQDGSTFEHNQSYLGIANYPEIQKAQKDFIQSGTSLFTQELSWSDAGAEFAFILSFRRLPLDETRAAILVGIPAGELFTVKKELEVQRAKAEYSSRLVTLGEMAAGIAHEINNPLAVILGNTTQVTRLINIEIPAPTAGKEKLLDRVEKISKTSQRISKIIQGLRAFSRQGNSDAFEPTTLKSLIEDTTELCRERFYHNGVSLIIAQVPELTIPVRAIQISQVLINLLNNAYDAVKGSPEKFIQITFHETHEDLFIRISDSGSGVPTHVEEKIFEPFFTTKQIGEGTGLGLSISKGILLDHGGDLTLVKNSPLTTFELRIPKTHKAALPMAS